MINEAYEIAREAVKRMHTNLGPGATFPPDMIWGYAPSPVASGQRPAAITWLRKKHYIEPTGKMVNAATDARAGSKTPEYRFGSSLVVASSDLSLLCQDFEKSCEGVLRLSRTQVLRFCSSLFAKRFVILSGLAGSGKTKLALAFARWITPAVGDDHSFYRLVPVGADWTSNENILGYPDALTSGRYVTRPSLELICDAVDSPGSPHFLILDEMNLSHVERYFADLLSALESEEDLPLYEGGPLFANGRKIEGRLALPPNLFVIGTVNVDETTYMFSPKVLDRANVIEFRMDEVGVSQFVADPHPADLSRLDALGSRYGSALVKAASDDSVTIPPAIKKVFESEMLLLFRILQKHEAEFGYRLMHESARFLSFYQRLGCFETGNAEWFREGMDSIVVQKILPKLHGSRSKLEGLLWALAWLTGGGRDETDSAELEARCVEAGAAQDEARFGPEVLWLELAKKNPDRPVEAANYPVAYDKVMRMWRKLVRDQFVTFAEA